MIGTGELMDDLERRGVAFDLVDGQLELCAPAGVLTTAVRALVTAHKAAIARLVRSAGGAREYGTTEEAPAGTADERAALAALNAAPGHRLGHADWLAASELPPPRFDRARRMLLAAGKVRNLGPTGGGSVPIAAARR